jgi:uncharacterized C2H2 Zn-finger protein
VDKSMFIQRCAVVLRSCAGYFLFHVNKVHRWA